MYIPLVFLCISRHDTLFPSLSMFSPRSRNVSLFSATITTMNECYFAFSARVHFCSHCSPLSLLPQEGTRAFSFSFSFLARYLLTYPSPSPSPRTSFFTQLFHGKDSRNRHRRSPDHSARKGLPAKERNSLLSSYTKHLTLSGLL